MPVSINIQQPLSQAEKDEIVAETVTQVNANSSINDLGNLAVDPSSPNNGQFWYNVSEGTLKMKTPTGIVPLEQGSDEWNNLNW